MELRRDKYTCYAWAGGTFFPVVLLCQFSALAGNRFWFYIGPFFPVVLYVVSVFGSGKKKVLVYIRMYLEYNTVVVLC